MPGPQIARVFFMDQWDRRLRVTSGRPLSEFGRPDGMSGFIVFGLHFQ
jgi:hypothetical protein